jgi:hypothetical protein
MPSAAAAAAAQFTALLRARTVAGDTRPDKQRSSSAVGCLETTRSCGGQLLMLLLYRSRSPCCRFAPDVLYRPSFRAAAGRQQAGRLAGAGCSHSSRQGYTLKQVAMAMYQLLVHLQLSAVSTRQPMQLMKTDVPPA